MSAHSTELSPAHDATFVRRTRTSMKLAIASVAVVGAIVLAAAAVGMSRGSAAPLVVRSGGGHLAPLTSSFERALDTGSAAVAGTAAGTSVAIGPSTLIIKSPVTGRNMRVPADSWPVERATESQVGATTATSTVLVINAAGDRHRMPLP